MKKQKVTIKKKLKGVGSIIITNKLIIEKESGNYLLNL